MVDRHLLGLVHVLILPIGDGSQIFQVMFKKAERTPFQSISSDVSTPNDHKNSSKFIPFNPGKVEVFHPMASHLPIPGRGVWRGRHGEFGAGGEHLWDGQISGMVES